MTNAEDAMNHEVAPAGLTRGQVAERLGVAVATVRRMEGKRLHPRLQDGVWVFDRREVEEVATTRGKTGHAAPPSSGSVAAATFKLLDAGRTFREIVQLTEQPPALVRSLYREWRFGFSAPSPDVEVEILERARDRDERELRAWEERMIDLARQEDDYDLRARDARGIRRERGTRAARGADERGRNGRPQERVTTRPVE